MTKVWKAVIYPLVAILAVAVSRTTLAASNCPSDFPKFADGSIVTKVAGKWVQARKSLSAISDVQGTINLTYVANRPTAAEGALVVKIVSAKGNSQGGKINVERGRWPSVCPNPNTDAFGEAVDRESWFGFHKSKQADADLEKSGDKTILRFHRKYANRRGKNGFENCVWTASNGRGNRKQFLLSSEKERGFWTAIATATQTVFLIDEAIAATGLDSTVRMYHYAADENGKACVKITLSRLDWANRVTVNDLEKKGRSYSTLGLMRHLGDQNILD